MTKAEKLRSKGSSILKDKPSGIGEFLNVSSQNSKNSRMPKPTIPQNGKSAIGSRISSEDNPSKKSEKETLARLHIEIRQDLMNWLLEAVFTRKRDPHFKRIQATQRAIIEEALQYYFENQRK